MKLFCFEVLAAMRYFSLVRSDFQYHQLVGEWNDFGCMPSTWSYNFMWVFHPPSFLSLPPFISCSPAPFLPSLLASFLHVFFFLPNLSPFLHPFLPPILLAFLPSFLVLLMILFLPLPLECWMCGFFSFTWFLVSDLQI